MSRQDDWRNLAATLGRILAGERAPEKLLPGLDATDTFIVAEVLRGLGVEISGAQEPEAERQAGMALDNLLDLVAAAVRPDAPPGLAEQLHAATHTMSTDPNAPPEIRALGRVLNRLLSGEREPDLSGLSPGLANEIRERF